MNLQERQSEPEVTPDLIAEAAAWLAVLHGPNRTNATERGFSKWLKRSGGHARAFEEATGIWEEARNLPRPMRLRELQRISRGHSFFQKTAWAAAALGAIAIAVVGYLQNSSVATGIGEQRVLALDDGTRVILNTDTRVVVDYSREVRGIDLKEGEALFEVAKDSRRPFVVTAGDRRIQALGTLFNVRRDDNQVAVTLVEGRVTVTSVVASAANVLPVELTLGERVVFARAKPPKADRPQLDKVLAWQRREVALDNVALNDAIAEMNRYNRKQLVAAAAESQTIRVTGLFRAGDSMSFARAVAEAYHLEITEENGEIRLVDGSVLSPKTP